jgi:hypothetical protein
LQPATNPRSECDVTRAQIEALTRDETLTLQDRDGDSVAIDGAQIDNPSLEMILDGYPEQVTAGNVDFELRITDAESQ